MSAWVKLPPWQGTVHHGCIHERSVSALLPMGALIAVGFGSALITRDGETVFDGERSDDFHYLSEFEAMAAAAPDHDWRCILFGPLRGKAYQRQGTGQWVLYESNEGFA